MTKLSIEDLAAELIRKIEAGDIGNEQGKMPSERELLAIYPVSRYTLRQALNKLSKMGWTIKCKNPPLNKEILASMKT